MLHKYDFMVFLPLVDFLCTHNSLISHSLILSFFHSIFSGPPTGANVVHPVGKVESGVALMSARRSVCATSLTNTSSSHSRVILDPFSSHCRDIALNYLMIWEDYMACLERARKACIHSPKERARGEVLDSWSIGANTFYKIHRLLKHLCDDVT